VEYFHEGSPNAVITERRARGLIDRMLAALGDLKRVLLVPPDVTRAASWAGPLTVMLYERLKASAHVEILPALGTHAPMTLSLIHISEPTRPY